MIWFYVWALFMLSRFHIKRCHKLTIYSWPSACVMKNVDFCAHVRRSSWCWGCVVVCVHTVCARDGNCSRGGAQIKQIRLIREHKLNFLDPILLFVRSFGALWIGNVNADEMMMECRLQYILRPYTWRISSKLMKISAFTPLATHTRTRDGALFCWHDITIKQKF